MTGAQRRKLQRAAHLGAGLVLIGYVYAPVGAHLHDAVRLFVLPVLALTGIVMWQSARTRRLQKAFKRARPAFLTASVSSAKPSTRGAE